MSWSGYVHRVLLDFADLALLFIFLHFHESIHSFTNIPILLK